MGDDWCCAEAHTCHPAGPTPEFGWFCIMRRTSYVPPVTRIGSVVRSASVDVLPVAKRARTVISEPTIIGSSYYGGLGSYGGSYYGGLGYGGYYGGARVIGGYGGLYGGYGSGITRVL